MGRPAALRRGHAITTVTTVTALPANRKRASSMFPKGDTSEADRYPKRSRFQASPYQAPESLLKIRKFLDISKVQAKVDVPAPSKLKTSSRAKRGKVDTKTKNTRAKVKDRALPGKVGSPELNKPKGLQRKRKKVQDTAVQLSKVSPKRTVGLRNGRKSVRDEKHSDKKAEKRKVGEGNVRARKLSKKDSKAADGMAAGGSEVGVNEKTGNGKRGKAVPRGRKGKRGLVLEPKPHVTSYELDPTFESRLEVPSVSSLADSRLVIRAVLLKDNRMLESIILKSNKRICSRKIPRSHSDPSTAFTYALEQENIPAIKMLIDDKNIDKLAPFPGITLEKDSTGHGSRLMFGHALSQVTVARGGKEGNGAFLKDQSLYNAGSRNYVDQSAVRTALQAGVKFETLENLGKLIDNSNVMTWCCDGVIHALRAGHRELAGKIIAEANLRGGFGFNALHEHVLLKKTDPLQPYKSVSVVKKCTGNARVTPLHCAAINPNPLYLTTLLNTNPQINVMDSDNWTLLHYAAVCSSPQPLEYLLSRGGISSLSVNKEGSTPIHLASQHGRLENVRAILKNELASLQEDEEESKNAEAEESNDKSKDQEGQRLGRTSLVVVNKKGLNALQTAASFGWTSVVAALLEVPGMDVNKATTAQHEKMSPLILASQLGHLATVKLLCENQEKYGVKLEQPDRRGRTALAHAVINGHAHIVSFLLRFGLNHLTRDSSGNTLLHYAAAYGWYFNCKLLIEAGCPVNCSNLWKLTPIAAAFMKGHVGIVQFLLEHPDVDINSPVNYQTGMTLLLETCSSSPSNELVNRIRSLVDDQGADPKLTDYNKNNALHLLVLSEAHQIGKHKYSSTSYDSSQEQKYLLDIADFFVNRGCDPLAKNDHKESAVSLAVNLGCFAFLSRLLDSHDLELDTSLDEQDNTLLHALVKHANNASAENFFRRLSKKASNLSAMTEMARMRNREGLTPLLQLIVTISGNRSLEDKEIKRVCDILSSLIHNLKSDVDAATQDERRNPALHLACEAYNGHEYLKVLLKAKPNLESLNAERNTPLVVAVLGGKETLVKILLNAGADANARVQRTGKEPLPVLLEVADKAIGGSFSLIPLLVQKGADVGSVDTEGNSALHLVCRKPSTAYCAEAVQEILGKGYRADHTNKKGRTPLHLCVNGRGGETDVTYEVEDMLIEAAPNTLSMRDVRGRIPLHYAFVKIGDFLNKSFIDPIELVALLVKAMKDAGVAKEVEFVDVFQSAPLHYAAARGATISATLLTADSSRMMDGADKDGNTPFGLAVLNGHQACALFFQQKKAKFTVSINKNREEAVKTSQKNENTWIWKHREQQDTQTKIKSRKDKIVSLLEQVASQEWQGILYLLIESLRESGSGVAPALQAAIKTGRLKLAQKILSRVKRASELAVPDKEGSVLLTLAKHCGEGVNDQVQILTMILAKGVDISTKDEFESSAIIHAATTRNASLCRLLAERLLQANPGQLSKIVDRDSFGRSVFSALFTNLSNEKLSDGIKDFVNKFVTPGDWNVRSYFPIQLSPLPAARYVALAELEVSASADRTSLPPLIVCVIYGNYAGAKWLLTHPSCPADVNFPDSRGRTALMHAVRLNDIKMVKLLLNPRHYAPEDDNVPWGDRRFFAASTKADLLARDKDGHTVFHYLICPTELPFSYVKSDLILNILLKSSAAGKAALAADKPFLAKALALNRYHLLQAIHKLTGIPVPKQTKLELPDFPLIDQLRSSPPKNISQDALAMANKGMTESALQDGQRNLPKPDPLVGQEAEVYEVVVKDDKVYDCVLTKVDINYGIYGMYNFYKMQLLEQPKGKGMLILFTRWGRVGDDGQYQKTPFGSLEEGLKEFGKIFRSKSGNAWEDLENFNPVPGRYRLVNKDLRKQLPPHVPVDFDALESSSRSFGTKLSAQTFKLIKDLSMIHRTKGRAREDLHSETLVNDLPFGLVTPETLERGEGILEKIKKLVSDKGTLDKDQSGNSRKAEEQKLMEALVECSEEFYSVIPIHGFASERIRPIFNADDVREKEEMIHRLLHMQSATQLLFASLYNAGQMNPMDYIYASLQTKIEIMSKNDFETDMILQYVQNTGKDHYGREPRVLNIFRVDREGEARGIRESGIGNPWLLWHGTRAENLLSILRSGLQVTPIGTNLNGSLFGRGIYFADMFTKSIGYTGDDDRKYIFLCEVVLGKVHHVHTTEVNENIPKLPGEFHSIKSADSRYEPDPGATIHWMNRTVPLGERSNRILGKDKFYGLDYNEYIVFKPKQVSIKYLVEFATIKHKPRHDSYSDGAESD